MPQNRKTPKSLIWGGIALLIIMIVVSFSDWIVKWLWLEQLGYQQIFLRIKGIQFALLLVGLVGALIYFGINFYLIEREVRRTGISTAHFGQIEIDISEPATMRSLSLIFKLMTLGISFLFAFAFFHQWDSFFRFNWHEMVGKTDPVFHNDIGFYMFRLPFINMIQSSLSTLTFMGSGIVIAFYFYTGLLRYDRYRGVVAPKPVVRHASINVSLWLLTIAWSFYLSRYSILYNNNGVVYGAGYTDIHVVLPVIWVLVFLSIALALLVGLQSYLNRIKWVIIGGISFLAIIIIGRLILPAAIENLIVKPNEFNLEEPYIKNNIALTRAAYGLDHVKVKEYAGTDSLTMQDIRDNQTTIDNIRLWDPRMLIQTYRQLQEIRLYYQFYKVNVDRYHTNHGYQEMMLSARELADQLPGKANTWVNKRLQYTHGYGLVMSPVTQKGTEGIPNLVIKNLPPESTNNLDVSQPSVYYGEHPTGYRVVNTKIRELDYPKGDNNVYTHYNGTGGIEVSNIWRRLLLAWDQGDINLLLSNYITDKSRFQMWRSVHKRVQEIAPFLTIEDDPYLVLNKGKLYWIQDAYTTSNNYPYSEPYGYDFNYIRNSVKIVVDAYSGSVTFYAVDTKDPVLEVYEEAFPKVFKPISEMPDSLRQHIRYPEFYFKVQMAQYNTYHMTNPQVFYNNEDLWTRPLEKYGGQSLIMEPYYILAKLPDENRLQYMLISPLTPNKRDNMIAWMAGKSDAPDYGDLLVYQLPKERLIYGPNQIESQIDQNTKISQQLSLWDQRGSQVIRGNLMVIPIRNSFIYVEPVFLIAEGLQIPQLQRVIVAYGDKISMEPTLKQCIDDIFGSGATAPETTQPVKQTVPTIMQIPQLRLVRSTWQQAQQALKQGDWETFGTKMKQLDGLMKSLTPSDTTR